MFSTIKLKVGFHLEIRKDKNENYAQNNEALKGAIVVDMEGWGELKKDKEIWKQQLVREMLAISLKNICGGVGF